MPFDRSFLKRFLTVLTLVAVLFAGETTVGKLWMNPISPGIFATVVGGAGYVVFTGLFLLVVGRLEGVFPTWLGAMLVVGLSFAMAAKLGLSSGSAVVLTVGITAVLVGLVAWSTGNPGREVLSLLFVLLVGVSPDWFGGAHAALPRELIRGAMGGMLLSAAVWLGTRVLPWLDERIWRRRRAVIGGVVLVMIAASWLWTVSWEEGEFEPYFSGTVPQVRAPADDLGELPNIILISVDTLRRDMVPPHSEESFAKEALADLYRDSVRFERMFSTSDWTLPAHGSLFTGLLPVEHGAVSGLGSRIRADRPTYTQILNDLGYRTAAFTDGGYVSRKLGFGRGFDHVWEQKFKSGDFLPGIIRLACLECGAPGALDPPTWAEMEEEKYRLFSRNLERARKWIELEEDRGRPFFVFLHTFQVHDYWHLYPSGIRRLKQEHPRLHDALLNERWPTPRELDEEIGLVPLKYAKRELDRGPRTRERRRSLHQWVKRRRRARWTLYHYQAERAYKQMKQFMKYLRENGLYRDSYVVFLSDHGEGFHLTSGAWGHSSRQLDEVLVRVPAWIKYPDGRRSDHVVRDLYQITDVFPLLFDDMGVEPANVLLDPSGPRSPGNLFGSGRSLVSGSSGARSKFPKLFFRSSCRKLIHDTETGRTHLQRVGKQDCSLEAGTDTDVLRGELHERLKRLERGPNPFEQTHFVLDPELVDELEGLGYL